MQKAVLTGVVLILALFGLIWGSTVIAQDEMCVPLNEITIAPLTADALRSEVVFPHAVHFGYACQQCHHTWNKTEPIVGCTASGCHDLETLPLTDDGKPVKDRLISIRYYKNAYHEMCIGCHKELKIQNKALEAAKRGLDQSLFASGPTGCNQCHPR